MARISTYQRDTVVTKNDKVIGTDSSGSITKNFKLEDIAGFFSNTNAIGITGQINFKFVTSNRTAQTISFNGLGGNNTTFNNVTEVVVSELDFDGNDIGNLIDRFSGQKVILVRLDDYSNFGIFDITNVSDHSETNFKTITLTNTVNNGSFIKDKYYGFGLFPTGSDEHYTHPNHTGHVTSAGDGATVLTVSAITGQTALTTGLASTDEFVISDGGVIKRMDVSVLQSYMQSNLTFTTNTNTTYDLNVQAGGANTSVIRLSGSDATNDDVTISGTSTTVKVTESGNIITLDLQDDVTIASQLTVGSTSETQAPVIYSKTGGGSENILLESTNSGSGSAPDLVLYRNAGVPSDSDTLGVVEFRGRNYPNSGTNTYNGIYSRIIDASQQHSALTFSAYYGSSTAHVMGIHNTANNSSSGKVVINPATFASVPTHTLDVNGDANISSDLGIGGDLTVTGDLTVSGSTTTVNTETINLADNIITLNSNYSGSSPTENGGIEVERGTLNNAVLRWNEGTDRWQFTNDGGTTYYNIPISTEYNNYTHPTHTARTIDLDATGASVISTIDFTSNTLGHVTSASATTRTLTLGNLGYTGATDADNYGSWTIQDGDTTSYTVTSGDTLQIASGGGITSNFTADDVLTISHNDTSSQSSVNNSGVTAIQDVTLDTYGHVTGLASVDLTSGINSLIDTKISATGYAATITDSVSGTTFNHGLGDDVIVQLYDATTKETVYADVERNGNYLNITFASTPANSIRVLVQQIN